jgi:AraC-like DNA-binding protein
MQRQQEFTDIKRFPELPGLMLMHAAYVTHRFSRHSHDGFAFGVIERGALEFSYRGAKLVASPGLINLANPDEAHDGHAGAEAGWTYRMFYCDPGIIQWATDEMTGKNAALPFFQEGVIADNNLALEIRALHVALFSGSLGRLEMESRFLQMVTRFIYRHADRSFPSIKVGHEHPAVLTAKRILEDLYYKNISLAELSLESGLSPYHLIRVFKAETGLSPHKYLSQIRVRRAEHLIREGHDLADTAYSVGFTDQSHLNRHFKGINGITPGVYRNFIQDTPV